jgi:4-hydroxy-tetrahydrodipicolinate synthase
VPDRAIAGIIPAVITPFRGDERIDYGAWQVILDRLIAAGVDGLFAGGSSGEFCSLDFEERTASLRFCQQSAAGRVPVIGNVGSITTRETVRLARAAESMNLDAIAVITPYYVKPSQDELLEHYVEICRAVRLPVLAYNFPQHGGAQLAPETLGKIAATCDNLIGVKDSSGDLEQAAAYLRCRSEGNFLVFVGPEQLTLRALEFGCAGVITGWGNVVPELFVRLYRCYRAGRRAEAERLQEFVDELAPAVFLHTFPSVLKEAMNVCGLPAGRCRKPLGPVPPKVSERVSRVLAKLEQEGFPAGTRRSVTA